MRYGNSLKTCEGMPVHMVCSLGSAYQNGGQKHAHGMTTAQDDDHQSNISFTGGDILQKNLSRARVGYDPTRPCGWLLPEARWPSPKIRMP